jgi:[acyl-carrier-protein] S-malonyltransferase
MGRELYESSPEARAVFEQADAALGFGLSALCFEGPEERLTATENAQPALLTVCAALLAAQGAGALSEPPAFVAGHSLGEYTALLAAGGLSFEQALRLVRRRGELMAQATAGGMAAIIGMEVVALEQVCREASQELGASVVIANYNAPGQLVISGDNAAVALASARAKERGAKRALPLKVSAAFHSPLMRAAAEQLALAIDAAPLADLSVPLLGNVGAQPLTTAAELRRELVAQVASPVRWIASVEYMAQAGVDRFIEIGPGSVLSGLVRRIAPAARLLNLSGPGHLAQ